MNIHYFKQFRRGCLVSVLVLSRRAGLNAPSLIDLQGFDAESLPFHFSCVAGDVLVPDVAVEDLSKNVENTDERTQGAEEGDSSHRADLLQDRVHPHAGHMMHPARPEDVSHSEGEDCSQTPHPAGIFVMGGPHLNDDERQNCGVHAMVEPLWDEVVQQFGVDQLPIVQVQRPEREHHKRSNRKSQHGHDPVPEGDELPELPLLLAALPRSGQETGDVNEDTQGEENSLDHQVYEGEKLPAAPVGLMSGHVQSFVVTKDGEVREEDGYPEDLRGDKRHYAPRPVVYAIARNKYTPLAHVKVN